MNAIKALKRDQDYYAAIRDANQARNDMEVMGGVICDLVDQAAILEHALRRIAEGRMGDLPCHIALVALAEYEGPRA